MGWSSMLVQDFFRLESLAQPALAQLQLLNSQTNWDGTGANYQNFLNWVAAYVTTYGRRRVSPDHVRLVLARYGGPSDAGTNAGIGAAVGGGLIAGGAALMANSGLTFATILAAGGSTLAFTAFTAGVGLVVIGVAVIGYYGYQWVSQNVATPAPGGGAIEIEPYLAFEEDPY